MQGYGCYEEDEFLPSPEEDEVMATHWAPPQHQGMRCACVHWNARDCSRLRLPRNPFEDPDDDRTCCDDECDCCCHDEGDEPYMEDY